MAKKTMGHYVDGKKLALELDKFHKSYDTENRVGVISTELGEMFIKVAENLGKRYNFAGYTYKEEMVSMGIEHLCKYAHNFDITHPKANAFAYVSRICYNGFVQCVKDEKKRSEMKDKLIKKAIERTEVDGWEIDESSNDDILEN